MIGHNNRDKSFSSGGKDSNILASTELAGDIWGHGKGSNGTGMGGKEAWVVAFPARATQ